MSGVPASVELFALHLLGALDGDEAARVAARYTARAADDLPSIEEAEALVAVVGAGAPVVEPPAGARERLLQRIAHDGPEVRSRRGAAPGVFPRPAGEAAAGPPPPSRRARWLVPVVLGAAFFGLAILNALQSSHPQTPAEDAELVNLLLDPATPRWVLASTSGAKGPFGVVVGDTARGRIFFSAPRLPVPDGGRAYVLWTIGRAPGSTPKNVGHVRLRADSRVVAELTGVGSLADVDTVAVSEETDVRTASPTSDRVVATGKAPGS